MTHLCDRSACSPSCRHDWLRPVCMSFGIAGCGTTEPAPTVDEPAVRGVCIISNVESDAFADCVEDFVPAAGAMFGQDRLPEIVLGAPRMAANGTPSTDVLSLGCGGSITLAFDGRGIENGPGVDFDVFENPFVVNDETFAEPGQVLVSADGTTWWEFTCEPTGDGTWPPEGCAGVTPTGDVTHHAVGSTRAGGDGFDLSEVGLSSVRYVRIRDRTREHYGNGQWCEGIAGGFDLDAIAAVER